jgi:hypothetical protein
VLTVQLETRDRQQRWNPVREDGAEECAVQIRSVRQQDDDDAAFGGLRGGKGSREAPASSDEVPVRHRRRAAVRQVTANVFLARIVPEVLKDRVSQGRRHVDSSRPKSATRRRLSVRVCQLDDRRHGIHAFGRDELIRNRHLELVLDEGKNLDEGDRIEKSRGDERRVRRQTQTRDP